MAVSAGNLPFTAIPTLRFDVLCAEPVIPAATPMLSFELAIAAPGGENVRSILLDVQIQIAARGRSYADAEQGRLLELFGTSDRWASTLRTLPWTRTTVIVPPFSGETTLPVQVPCSYDLEISANRYFAALADGEVPLEFLFSGSLFFAGPGGMLQTARIALDHEVAFRLPVATWRAMMDHHFPGRAWLRLDRQTFERLCAFKAGRALTSWEAAIGELLEGQA